MFYIDDFNRDESVSLESAVGLINSFGKGSSLLENMEVMRNHLLSIRDNEDFCDDWCYEINAYNKVFSDMSTMFS